MADNQNYSILFIRTNFDNLDKQRKQIILNYIYSVDDKLVRINDGNSYVDISKMNNDHLMMIMNLINNK